MSSAVSCVIIKSDRSTTRIPATGQMVRVLGEDGLFSVMQVDRKRRIVQLMERTGTHRLFDAPFASVRVFNRQLAQAIHRFLDLCEQTRNHESP